MKASVSYRLWISSDRFFLASSNFCFCCLSSAEAEIDWKSAPCFFAASGKKRINQNKKPFCSERGRVIFGVGLPSGKRTIPVLVQCLQRFRAPKVGCARSSLNSSEHCMGLFAAPEWKRQKYNRLAVRKGSWPGFRDVEFSRLEETLAGQLSTSQSKTNIYVIFGCPRSCPLSQTLLSLQQLNHSAPHQPWLSVLLPPFPFLGSLTVLKPPHFIPGELRAAKSCYGLTLCCLKWRQLMELKGVNKTSKWHLEHSLNNLSPALQGAQRVWYKVLYRNKTEAEKTGDIPGATKGTCFDTNKSTRNKVGSQEVPCIADLTDLYLVFLRSFQGWQK